MHKAVYYSGICECDSVLGFDALQSGMLPLDHCDTGIKKHLDEVVWSLASVIRPQIF